MHAQGRSPDPKHALKDGLKRRMLKGAFGTFYSIDTLRIRFYAFLSHLFLGRAKENRHTLYLQEIRGKHLLQSSEKDGIRI